MKAYSMDLRTRVVAAYDRGEGSQSDIARRFGVSARRLQKLLQRRRQTGSVAAKPHGGGRPAKVCGPAQERLRRAVAETPDATLDELLQRCGVRGSRMCIFRALRRLKITRKKSPSRVRSGRTRRSGASARPGSNGPQG